MISIPSGLSEDICIQWVKKPELNRIYTHNIPKCKRSCKEISYTQNTHIEAATHAKNRTA